MQRSDPLVGRCRRALLAFAYLGVSVAVAGSEEPPGQFFPLPGETGSARLVGLGGAVVGLGGDVNAILTNPAGLVAVPRTIDLAASVGAKSQPSFGAAVHPRRGLAAGVFVWARSASAALVSASLDRMATLPAMRADFLSPAVSLAFSPDRRFGFGAGCQWSRFSLREREVTSPKESGRSCLLGFFLQPDNPDAVRLGIVYRHNRAVEFTTGAGPTGAVSHTRTRLPDVFGAGISWRYDMLKNTRLVTSLQPELVRYSVLRAGLGNVGRVRDLHDDLDLRMAVEASFPFGSCVTGCGSMWQLRTAVVSRAPVPFASTLDLDPSGEVPSVQSPKRTTSWSVGLSLALETLFGGNLRLDAGYRHADRTLIGGIALRYPEAYRSDLQHHRT